MKFLPFSFLVLMCLVMLGNSFAQQNNTIKAASSYLEIKTSALDKYLNRSTRIQERLLRRLKKKEACMLRKLASKDSTLYREYTALSLTYDSIATLSKDSVALAAKGEIRNTSIDSLKGIQQFINVQGSKLSALSNIGTKNLPAKDYTAKLSELQAKLNAEQQIKELIGQRTRNLEQLAAKSNMPGLQGIQKQVYYAQKKIKAWRSLADDPDDAEENALEYLQGIEGFENYVTDRDLAFGGLGVNATAADLRSLGYQTKGHLKQLLREKFGGNLQAVQQSMGEQVQLFSEKLNSVTNKVNEGKGELNEAKQGLHEAKDKLKHIEKPTFAKNPERGKPFWLRLEKQYNFQSNRATSDGLRPAMLELGASVAFKQTSKLSYGIGLATNIGLGHNWQNIKLSYEGISARAYADWLLIYGFSLQIGYEHIFRPYNRSYINEQHSATGLNQQHNDNTLKEIFGGTEQSAYAGITKRYNLNKKFKGTILFGYNFFWQQSNMRSPFLIRFGWAK